MAKIPTRLEDLLPFGAYEKVVDLLHNPDLSGKVREALQKVGIQKVNPLDHVQDAWQQAKSWLASVTQHAPATSSRRINATGQLWTSDGAIPPAIPAVSQAFARASSIFADKQHCLQRSHEIVQRTLGISPHIWLSDCLSSLQIATRTLGDSALIARCDCVRVPGIGDIRSMLAAFGNRVAEIGANNACSLQDWEQSLSAQGSVVVIVSPSMLPRDQWTQHRKSAIESARSAGRKSVEVVLDGTVSRSIAKALGLPLLADRIVDSADVTIVPTQLFMGGIKGTFCFGSESTIQSMALAARSISAELDTSAITGNLLAMQLANLDEDVDLGVLGGLTANPQNLRSRCERLAIQLDKVGDIQSAQVVDSQHSLGSSPWDQYQLANPVIKLQVINSAVLCARTRQGRDDLPGIDTRQQGDTLNIDLRFVSPEDDHLIVESFAPPE